MDRLPHEPVSMERVWGDGFREGAFPWAADQFAAYARMLRFWATKPGVMPSALHVRLANKQLIIVKPKPHSTRSPG